MAPAQTLGRADIALIGCVKTKAGYPMPARDLYLSPLFLRRREYAEQQAYRCYILSAEHALVPPETVLAPYDTALADQTSEYRRAWGQWVLAKLVRAEGSLRGRIVEVHAGDEYSRPIAHLLEQAGATVRRPLAGLTLGEQLAWYDQQPKDLVPTQARPVETQPSVVPSTSQAVVAALLRYGREHQAERADAPPRFTPDPDANTLVLTDPFAFLLAVLFDQGIPAERAWQAPYELRRRLGHLDPAGIVADPKGVRAAVAQQPALHRYVNNMSVWVVAAAGLVVDRYGSDAGLVWSGEPRAADLAARLRTLPGIGQKKAAMAVEILAREVPRGLRTRPQVG
ncbi:hypothetical protein OG792_02140 [Micromonospora sp. NBC_01699]|uniref:DUF6884 domain-containing protein n=1 Tax=Micromonospora sp. NBC_01699 TaxID=2975984 RepID=UPI002E2CC89E|nr:DUF6884 domain-containing protein [Micromonospora sp. NBC_01699]